LFKRLVIFEVEVDFLLEDTIDGADFRVGGAVAFTFGVENGVDVKG